MSDITQLTKLHEATTQGDWQRCQGNNGTCQCGLVWSSEPDTVVANCGSDPSRPDELPIITDEQMVANSDWIAEAHNAWPAVAARLALLEEFARRVRDANTDAPLIVRGIKSGQAVDWLDAETKKAGKT